jgi:hypothetical protein
VIGLRLALIRAAINSLALRPFLGNRCPKSVDAQSESGYQCTGCASSVISFRTTDSDAALWPKNLIQCAQHRCEALLRAASGDPRATEMDPAWTNSRKW